MVRSTAPLSASLSYLIGPGPAEARSRTTLRVGVANGGERVDAVRLRLVLSPCEAKAPPLARVELGLVLPRRAGRELEALIDWSAGRLGLGSRSSAFAVVPAGRRHVVRAELFDGKGCGPAVLEVGVTSATSAETTRPATRAV